MRKVSPNNLAMPQILNTNLMGDGWKTVIVDKKDIMERVVAERMISIKHIKTPRLLGGIGMKYSTILPYLKKGDRVLDICAGSGTGSMILAESGMKVTAVDYCTTILEFRSGIDIINLDLRTEELPFDSYFDGVTCVDAIEHFEEGMQNALLLKIHKSLKPNGVLMIDTPLSEITGPKSKHHVRELTAEDFRSVVESNGFTIEHRYIVRTIGNCFAVLFIQDDATVGQKNDGQIIVARKAK